MTRIGADEKGDRLWTVDLDTEACLEFCGRAIVRNGRRIIWASREERMTQRPEPSGEQREMTTWRFVVTAHRSP